MTQLKRFKWKCRETMADGFTLVEVLIVIVTIGILVALLLPAVQAAREAARRMQCANNAKQLAFATLNHESAIAFFPTGGWSKQWIGHPDRGFDKRQPGGWVYNILPFLEQEALRDLGADGSGISIEDANFSRITTPLPVMNCPSRRATGLYRYYRHFETQFRLVSANVTQIARGDYAMNGGDFAQWHRASPSTLIEGDGVFAWDDMSRQTGLSYQRSQVAMSDIKDGASNTFLIGEKYINCEHYTDGKDSGDNTTMYNGGDLELLRWTGINGSVFDADNRSNLPRQDKATIGDGDSSQWFGSAHTSTFNMSFCDGSVRLVSYLIDGEVYRRLGNRKDQLPANSDHL